jgi:hypothetical protein
MSLRTGLFAALLLGSTALPAWAADYYVAPLGAAPVSSPDGSRERPFGSVGAALKSGKIAGGDTVMLMDGSHGGVFFSKIGFDRPVTFRSERVKEAHFDFIQIDGDVRNIIISDVKVWRPEGDGSGYLVRSYSGATGITLDNVDIRSRENATDYLKWDLTRWAAVAGDGANGVDLRGSGNIVRNSTITGVRYGIMVGPGSLVENNVIDGFTADGLRGCSNIIFQKNIVRNAISLSDGVHRDGLQCYSPSASSGLKVVGNTFIDWAHANRSHPLRGAMQGVGLYDGYYDDLEIVNNIVITTHYHGITVNGTRRARIANNTVVHTEGQAQGYPWISLGKTKVGEPSQNVVVANNLAMKISGTSDAALGNLFTDNRVILDPKAVFEDLSQWNFRPKASSGFLDVANASYAPLTDILGHARPSGAGPDLGAYEVGASGGAAVEEPMTGGTAPTPEPVTTDGSPTETTSPIETTPEAPATTSDPAPATDTSTTGTTTTDTTTTTGTTTGATTTTDPARTAGKWTKPPKSLKFLRR